MQARDNPGCRSLPDRNHGYDEKLTFRTFINVDHLVSLEAGGSASIMSNLSVAFLPGLLVLPSEKGEYSLRTTIY